eukprot:11670639-Karenia_brevis.AAC.1
MLVLWLNLAYCNQKLQSAVDFQVGPPTLGQHKVYLVIARAAEISVEKSTQGIDPVSWNEELQKAGLGYDGEEVSRPARLTLVQIKAGLLPAEVGASVDVLCVCTEE